MLILSMRAKNLRLIRAQMQQRGCARPADSGDTAKSKFAAEVEVPLRSVAVSSSTYFGAFEVS